MSKLTLGDKIKILVQISKSSYFFFVVLAFLILLGILFFTTKKRTKQMNRQIYIIYSLVLFSILLIGYSSSLRYSFDYLVNHLFIAVLFPNFAIYFAGFVITNIIFWISLFSNKTNEVIRKVNIIVYLILTYLLVCILRVVDTNQLDVFSESSIYLNEKATALIELSTGLFLLWIFFLIIYKGILHYLKREKPQEVKKVVVTKAVKMLPKNYQPTRLPDYMFGNPGKRVTLVETNPYRLIEDYEKKLTLEDYQLLLKILKEAKAKKQMPISENLTSRRIQQMKEQERLREREKYTELDMLYRSMR